MARKSLHIAEQHLEKAKNAAIDLGLNQKEIALRLGCSRQPVSRFFNCKPLSNKLFVRICQILKLDWQEVTGSYTPENRKDMGVVNKSADYSSDSGNNNLKNIDRETRVSHGNYNEAIQGNYVHVAGNYIQNTPTSDQASVSKPLNIENLVTQLRQQVRQDIETRCGTMRILDMSQPIGLNDIYTKVNILEKISGRRRKDIAQLIDDCDSENFDRFNFGQVQEKIPGKEAVEKYQTLLILGKPGAGKTTFLKHLAIQCSQGAFQGNLVPFFITLKEFAEAENQPKLLDYFSRSINHQSKNDLDIFLNRRYVSNDSENNLYSILNHGKALICLDGLDEVLERDTKRIIKEIEELVCKYPQNQYLMTCRIAAKEYTFSQFTEVEIADFDRQQITIFAKNWFQNKPIKPETFLDRIETDEPIKELASNPLLLTLLCLVFEESGSFPGNRAGLYKEGIDALLKKWDAKRGIQRDDVYKKLWTQRKEDLLSNLAWETFSQGEYFFKQDKAERSIGKYIRNLPGANVDKEALKLDSEAVLKSIESQHGLLVERAKGIYSFSHLTFQEYFAAREIIVVRQSSDEALKELVSHLFDKRWREVFMLAVAMSPDAEKLILKIKHITDNSVTRHEKAQVFLDHIKNKSLYISEKSQISDFNTLKNLLSLEVKNKETLIRFLYFCMLLPVVRISSKGSFSTNTYFIFDICFTDLIVEHYFKIEIAEHESIEKTKKMYGNYNYRLDEFDSLYTYTIHLAYLINENMGLELYKLYKQLPWDSDSDSFMFYLMTKGKSIIKLLREIGTHYYQIGYNYNFNRDLKLVFKHYYYASNLLASCLYQDCYITPEVREEIEETLLLPIAEIEKRKNKLSH